MNDRIASGHQPSWDVDLKFGEQGQLIVLNMLEDLMRGRLHIEVKRDAQFLKTGRLYVECAQNPRCRGYWWPSGILTSKAEAWAFLCAEDRGLFIVDTLWLDRATNLAGQDIRNHGEESDGKNPTRGVCIYLNHLATTRQLVAPSVPARAPMARK